MNIEEGLMEEELKSKGDRDIRLTLSEYREIERAMQWPEDLARYDRIAKPTNLTEIQFTGELP